MLDANAGPLGIDYHTRNYFVLDGKTGAWLAGSASSDALPMEQSLNLLTARSAVARGDPSGVGDETYLNAEYMDAAVDDAVVIEAFVQGKQSWWDDSATIYTQDADGAYSADGQEFANLQDAIDALSGKTGTISVKTDVTETGTFTIPDGTSIVLKSDGGKLTINDEGKGIGVVIGDQTYYVNSERTDFTTK